MCRYATQPLDTVKTRYVVSTPPYTEAVTDSEQDAIAGSQEELQEQFLLLCANRQERGCLDSLVWSVTSSCAIDYEWWNCVYHVRPLSYASH